jgi:hypothetical protein
VVRTALLLAETASGKAEDIANLIKHVDGIKAVHIVSESYGAIALVEADDSDGIRDIASRIALTSGVFRCVVCSERELTETDSLEVKGFAGMVDDDDSCWCVREPASENLRPLSPSTGWKPTKARNK